MKICRQCNEKKAPSDFYNISKSSDGLHSYCKKCHNENSRISHKKTYIYHPKIKTGYKVCGCCKKKLPETTEYFFTKKHKQKLKDGSIAEYICYRSLCKKCHAIKTKIHTQEKRCKELGCSLSDYRKAWKKQMWDKKTKHKEIYALNIPDSKKQTIIKKIRKGYKFTTYEAYIEYAKKELRKSLAARCIYDDLPKGYTIWKEVPYDIKKKIVNRRITDAKLANWIGVKVSQATREMLLTKRLLVEINRYIKSM